MPGKSKPGAKWKPSFLVPDSSFNNHPSSNPNAPILDAPSSTTKSRLTATIVEPPAPSKRRSRSNDKKSNKETYKDGFGHHSKQKPISTVYTKQLLAMTPSNHYSSDEPRWKDPEILTLLNARLVEDAELESVVYPPLLPLEVSAPEIYSYLTAAHTGIKIPLLWKQCLNSLEHFVETDPTTVVSSNIDLAVQRYPAGGGSRNSPLRERVSRRTRARQSDPSPTLRAPKSNSALAGTNRPLAINFLRAICSEFSDCLAFEDLRYAWVINMYGHRKIRVGVNPDDKVKVLMREDICWRATKDPVKGLSPREWTSKKRGLGPLFAVLTKDWNEFADVKRSCLADLKTLLTILQDRRREASYTATDDIFSKDTQYWSYIISVTSNKTPCVSINTLSASGRYLADMENGRYPAKGDELVYRKGKPICLVDLNGRIEFARVMMGLLGRVCVRKERRGEEEMLLDELPEESSQGTGKGPGSGGIVASTAWGRVKRRSWFIKQSTAVTPSHAKASPKVSHWISTLELD